MATSFDIRNAVLGEPVVKTVLTRLLAFCALAVLVAGCSSGGSGAGSGASSGADNNAEKVKAFWQWFEKNEQQLFASKDDSDDATLADLDKQLESINPDLTFEFGPESSGKRDFVIGANGLEEVIPVVMSTVASAPKLPRWRVIAFRQKQRAPKPVKQGKVMVSPEKVTFLLKPDGDRASITLYVKGYDNSDDYEEATLILLDETLGEYDSITRLNDIDIKPRTEDRRRAAKPLPQLCAELDKIVAPSKAP
ncbi:MAG: hypothetical protein U0105_09860 [Candidatus Obscuribacterales bacterium]